MTRTLTLAACATLLMVVSVRAQNTTTTTQDPINRPQNIAQTDGTAGKAAVNDMLFAAAAASSGLAEVTISELGQQRATDPELKKFSQQMVQDHTRLNSELTTLAAQKRAALPRAADFRAQFCHRAWLVFPAKSSTTVMPKPSLSVTSNRLLSSRPRPSEAKILI
jgi:predicted outer membrane protein